MMLHEGTNEWMQVSAVSTPKRAEDLRRGNRYEREQEGGRERRMEGRRKEGGRKRIKKGENVKVRERGGEGEKKEGRRKEGQKGDTCNTAHKISQHH